MKRIRFVMCFILALALLGSLSACGAGKNKKPTGDPAAAASPSDQPTDPQSESLPFTQLDPQPTIDKPLGADTDPTTYPELEDVTAPTVAILPVEGDKEK